MENEEIRSTGFRYTEDNVTFTSVKNPSTLVPNVLGRRGRWTSNGESIPNIDNEKPLINAVDIDWNGIEIDNNTLINTTADLINYIKSKEGLGSTPDTPLNQTISYTISCYRWYKEDITNPIAPKDDNNLSPEANDYLNSPNQAFPETKWAQFAPNRPSGNNWILWLSCSEITKNLNNNTYSTTSWQPPFQITGATGTAGEDNFKREYIYKRFTNELTFGNNNNNPAYWAAQLQDDYFAGGWEDNPQGVTEQYPFEYCAYRTKENGAWGKFSTPNIWSHYGINGTDGDGIEYVFVRTNVNKAPFITIGINDNLYEDEYRPIANLNIQTSVSLNDNLEEQIPHISGGEPYENDNFAGYSQARCSDNPIGVDNIYRYEWVLQRKKKNGVWLSYANINPTSGTQYMSLWAVRGQDGKGDTISIIDGEIYINGEGTGVVIDNPDGTGSKVISLNSLSDINYDEGQLGLFGGHLYVLINGQWVSVGESSGTGNYVHIAYADNVEYYTINNKRVIKVTNPKTGTSAEPKNWLGICANNEKQDPGNIEDEDDLDWAQYKWQWLKGADGKDREFIFCLTKQNIAPGFDESDGITGTLPDNWQSVSKSEDEFYPKVITTDINGNIITVHNSLKNPTNENFYWTDDPIASVSSEFPYLWWTNRVKVNGVWSSFEKVTRVSGDPAPQIKEEWEAWSNISDLATFESEEKDVNNNSKDYSEFRTEWSVTTPGRPENKPDFIHLWRRTRVRILQNNGTYSSSGYTYVRITGTNGTSIDVKGTVKKIYPTANSNSDPNISDPISNYISDLNVGDLFIVHGLRNVYKKGENSSYSTEREALDGDSYVIDGPCEDPTGINVKGDLYIWLDESEDWVNIGKFTPENGKTYYTHVAWAESVVLINDPEHPNKRNDFEGNADLDILDSDSIIKNATIYPNPDIDYAYSGVLIDETPIDKYDIEENNDWWKPYIWTKVQGPPGTDGRYKEYIYGYASSFSGTDNENKELNAKRTGTANNENISVTDYIEKESTKIYKCWTVDDFIPNGYKKDGITFDWSDNPRGVRDKQGLTVEYQAYRRYNLLEKHWGDFSNPIEYSRWGKDGKDGDGLEYIFYAANESNSQPFSGELNPKNWNANSGSDRNGRKFKDDDYLGPNSDGNKWLDDPIDFLSSSNEYSPGAIEWVSIRKKKTVDGVYGWQGFCEPKVWSRLAKDGVANGYTVDLSNENMPVGTDSDGNVPKGEFSNTCKVQVYHNGLEIKHISKVGDLSAESYFTYNITKIRNNNNNAITATPDRDIITISNTEALSNFAGTNAYIDITVTLPNGTTREATITLFGVANGEPGKAIDLWTDASVIHENNSGNLTPNNLLVGVKVGTNITYAEDALKNNYTFKWNYTELSSIEHYITQDSDDYINLESGHTGVSLKMYYNKNLIDAETIPYVKDGKDADVIKTTCSPIKNIYINCNSNGYPVSGKLYNVHMDLYVNDIKKGNENNDMIQVVPLSAPSGITITTYNKNELMTNNVLYGSIPPYSALIEYSANTHRSNLEGDIVFNIYYPRDNPQYTAELVIPVICSNNGNNGNNGYTTIINPALFIINETAEKDNNGTISYSYDYDKKEVQIYIKKGNVNQSIGFNESSVKCYNKNSEALGDTIMKAKVSAVQGNDGGLLVKITKISNTIETTEGYVLVEITSPIKLSIKIPFYINLLERELFKIEGNLKTYTESLGYVEYRELEEKITASQKTLRSEYTEQIGKAGEYGRNLFGFHKGCNFSGRYACVQFIQGYGIAINKTFNDGNSNIRYRGRVSNLGFNNVGGLFVVQFSAKSADSNNRTLNVNLCDVKGIKGMGSLPSNSDIISINNTWQDFTLYFDISDNDAAASNLGGWIDFEEETSNSSNNIYIRHLMIERGSTKHSFCEADEDIAYIGQTQTISSFAIRATSLISVGDIEGRKNVYYTQNELDPSSISGNDFDLIESNNSFNLEANKIYTLSYWAKASSASGLVITNYLYASGNIIDYIGEDIYVEKEQYGSITHLVIKNGTIGEGITVDGLTNVAFSNNWKLYFIRFYVKYARNDAKLLFRLRKDSNKVYGGLYRKSKIYISDIQLQEGYGLEPTYFNSVIEQTARKISLVQQTGLKKAGIDIGNGTINLQADKVTFSDSNGGNTNKIWIDPEKGTLHAVDGEFSAIHAVDSEFSGTVYATSGEFTGTIHANGGDIGGLTIYPDWIGMDSGDKYIAIRKGNLQIGNVSKVGTSTITRKFTVDPSGNMTDGNGILSEKNSVLFTLPKNGTFNISPDNNAEATDIYLKAARTTINGNFYLPGAVITDTTVNLPSNPSNGMIVFCPNSTIINGNGNTIYTSSGDPKNSSWSTGNKKPRIFVYCICDNDSNPPKYGWKEFFGG